MLKCNHNLVLEIDLNYLRLYHWKHLDLWYFCLIDWIWPWYLGVDMKLWNNLVVQGPKKLYFVGLDENHQVLHLWALSRRCALGLCDFLVSFMGAPILQGFYRWVVVYQKERVLLTVLVFVVAVLSLFHYSMVLFVLFWITLLDNQVTNKVWLK